MPETASANILLIEDDHDVAEAIMLVLESNGYNVTHADNSAKARENLSGKTFGCALLDVWLGAEDGLAVLSDLRSEGEAIPVIVISGGGPGRTLENVTARADALGAFGVLYKPFGDSELLDAVKQALS